MPTRYRGDEREVRALNAFIRDVYHEQEILKAGKIPVEQVLTNAQYRPEMQAIDLPSGIYAHIAGIDVVRDGQRRQPGQRAVPVAARLVRVDRVGGDDLAGRPDPLRQPPRDRTVPGADLEAPPALVDRELAEAPGAERIVHGFERDEPGGLPVAFGLGLEHISHDSRASAVAVRLRLRNH